MARLLVRPLSARLLVCALFALALAAFALPFLTVSVDERRGSASGIQLATGSPELSGRYVHDAYRGEAETTFANGRGAALITLALAAVGLALGWLPGRLGPGIGLAAGFLGVAGAFAIFQRTTSAYELGETAHRYGFWLAAALFAVAAICSSLALAKAPPWFPPREERHDYFAQRDGRGD